MGNEVNQCLRRFVALGVYGARGINVAEISAEVYVRNDE